MTREEKANMIESIKTNLDTSSTIYLTDCSGLDADTTSKLRRACFKSNIKMSIVKNTLLFKAMESVDKDFGDLKSVLKGNTASIYSEFVKAPAKVIKNFRIFVKIHKNSSDDENYLVDHSSLFFLVDKNDEYLTHFRPSDFDSKIQYLL